MLAFCAMLSAGKPGETSSQRKYVIRPSVDAQLVLECCYRAVASLRLAQPPAVRGHMVIVALDQ